jgi:hypothetical protein
MRIPVHVCCLAPGRAEDAGFERFGNRLQNIAAGLRELRPMPRRPVPPALLARANEVIE